MSQYRFDELELAFNPDKKEEREEMESKLLDKYVDHESEKLLLKYRINELEKHKLQLIASSPGRFEESDRTEDLNKKGDDNDTKQKCLDNYKRLWSENGGNTSLYGTNQFELKLYTLDFNLSYFSDLKANPRWKLEKLKDYQEYSKGVLEQLEQTVVPRPPSPLSILATKDHANTPEYQQWRKMKEVTQKIATLRAKVDQLSIAGESQDSPKSLAKTSVNNLLDQLTKKLDEIKGNLNTEERQEQLQAWLTEAKTGAQAILPLLKEQSSPFQAVLEFLLDIKGIGYVVNAAHKGITGHSIFSTVQARSLLKEADETFVAPEEKPSSNTLSKH